MSTRRRTLIWLLPIALVLAQWLALTHGVLHARAWLPGVVGKVVVTAQHDAPHAWFGAHHQGSDCRLYDQMGCGDLAAASAPGSMPVQGAADLHAAPPPTWPAARTAVPFQARAPPARV